MKKIIYLLNPLICYNLSKTDLVFKFATYDYIQYNEENYYRAEDQESPYGEGQT